DHAAGCITITSGRDESTGGVRVAVSDNGRGVNPDIADSIFDPFQTDKQAEGGTGLGLSISYNIVKEHGGEISFVSDPGCGALFSVVLPQRQQSIRRKVLIADDDQSIHLLIKRALAELGDYEIESVYNGIEACIKLGTFQPELLILDLMMPEMDGLDVCRSVINEPNLRHTQVVLITASVEHANVARIRQLGFTTVVQKPFTLAAVRRVVHEVLNFQTRDA
ncbi:MAG: response regulator, partial [Deltaproteobacteria bacterium]|nr:response regulator [Deltaproteobacteria bacterium]